MLQISLRRFSTGVPVRRETVSGALRFRGPRRERAVVFDVLGLVEHAAVELARPILVDVDSEQVIRGDEDIDVFGAREPACAPASFRRRRRRISPRRTLEFGRPVVDERGGTDQQARARCARGCEPRCEKGDELHGFAQAHLVGEDARTPVGERVHPVDSFALIGRNVVVNQEGTARGFASDARNRSRYDSNEGERSAEWRVRRGRTPAMREAR